MNDSLLGRELKGVPRGTGYWNSVVIFLSNINDVKIYIYTLLVLKLVSYSFSLSFKFAQVIFRVRSFWFV